MFGILHIVGNSLTRFWRWVMIRPCEGETYVFSRVVKVALDVAEIEMNCTRVVETDLTIALRSNWSCLSQIIWFEFGEGEATSNRVIIVGGVSFEPSTKVSKSYPNRRDMNLSCHVE